VPAKRGQLSCSLSGLKSENPSQKPVCMNNANAARQYLRNKEIVKRQNKVQAKIYEDGSWYRSKNAVTAHSLFQCFVALCYLPPKRLAKCGADEVDLALNEIKGDASANTQASGIGGRMLLVCPCRCLYALAPC